MSPHWPVNINDPQRACALLSSAPETAVVFVHGFMGSSKNTWLDFQRLVDLFADRYPYWNSCDLFFYKFKSHDQIEPLADGFLRFLRQVLLGRSDLVQPAGLMKCMFNPPKFFTRPIDYRNLILVGHSTGGPIIRKAVLQEISWSQGVPRSGEGALDPALSRRVHDLILNSSVRLFAPAQVGAMCAGKLGYLLKCPIGEWLALPWLHSKPLFRNLQPGSDSLTSIRTETEKKQKDAGAPNCLFASSLFGQNDEIVHIGIYENDPNKDPKKWDTERNQGHTSVCKPSLQYTKPLEFVTDKKYGRTRANR